MYVAALFVTFAMVAFAIAGMDVERHFVRAKVAESANRYAQIALQEAEASLRAQIAEQVETGSPDGPFAPPSPSPASPVCGPGVPACPLFATTAVALSGQTSEPAPSGANERALNLQRAPGVFENRLGATLGVTISSPSGAVLAARSQNVTVRTFATPPYAVVDGISQATKRGSPEGDSAGCDPAAPACHRDDLVSASDTRVHASLTCDAATYGSKCDGLPDRPADAFSSPAWANDNARLPGWSR